VTAPSLSRDLAIAVVVIAVLLALPYLTPSKALLDFGIRCAATAMFATSLNLLVGYTGLVSFGHGMFYGLGAYAFSLLMQRTSMSLPLAFLATVAITALTAAVVGAVCIRLKTIYFAFVTLAMQMLLHSVIVSWSDLTGGDQGLMGGIPRRVVGPVDFGDHGTLYAAAACVLAVLALLAMRHIVSTSFGASLRMIRDNEPRAAFLGIGIWRVKLSVFVLAAVFAALGGMTMSLYLSGAYPAQVNWPVSGDAIFAIMLGGIGNFMGPLVGTVVLQLLNDVVTRQTEYHGLVLGGIILLFAMGLRRGVMDFYDVWVRDRKRPA
jgi:branched-chain amino acid transport system permease protein